MIQNLFNIVIFLLKFFILKIKMHQILQLYKFYNTGLSFMLNRYQKISLSHNCGSFWWYNVLEFIRLYWGDTVKQALSPRSFFLVAMCWRKRPSKHLLNFFQHIASSIWGSISHSPVYSKKGALRLDCSFLLWRRHTLNFHPWWSLY